VVVLLSYRVSLQLGNLSTDLVKEERARKNDYAMKADHVDV
jgi:hypothetical protein